MADRDYFPHKSAERLARDIGAKLERLRLTRNIKQSTLAQNAGISVRTLRRLESGEGATLDSFVRVLSSIGLAQNLDLLLPDPHIRPIERVKTGGAERQRSSARKADGPKTPWQWGDEN